MDKQESKLYKWIIIALGLMLLISLIAVVHNATKNQAAPATNEAQP